jgi:AcrR family transcriptional regulator
VTSAEPTPEAPRRRDRRARLLEEAARQLNSRRVSQTSLSDIAERVGVSRAALYYYFDDQADLVFQSYRRSCELMARRLDEAVHTGGGAIRMLEHFIDGVLSEEEPEIAALNEAAFLRPDQRDTILGLYDAIMGTIAEILRAGAREGELRACGDDVVAQAIVGLVCWVPVARRWHTNDLLSHGDMVEAVKSILKYGIAVDRRALPDYRPIALTAGTVRAEQVFDADLLAATKQEVLLASASWLFNLKGVDATSLEEIALRVGVTKKVIYHNVGDKETLVVACYRRALALNQDVADKVSAYDGDRLEAICAGFHASAESQLREDIAPLAPLGGSEALPPTAREEIHASASRLMDTYLEAFRLGQDEGSIRPLNSRAINAVRPGMFEWLPKWFRPTRPDANQYAARELANLTALGILSPDAPPPS